MKKLLAFAKKHKIISSLVALVLCFGVYHFVFAKKAATVDTYVYGTVERGTLVASISGSGQVSVSNQVDVKPKASGEITYLNVKNGQTVRAGALLAQLDSRDAQNSVRDAQISLENAQISLAKLKISQQSDAPKLQDSITTAQNNLTQAYQNGFNEVSNAFLDLTNILDGIRGILYDNTLKGSCSPNSCEYPNLASNDARWNMQLIVNQSLAAYTKALDSYTPNFSAYQSTSRDADTAKISDLIEQTRLTTLYMSEAAKSEQNMFDTLVADLNANKKSQNGSSPVPQGILDYQNSIASYIGKLNSHLTSFTSIQNTITSNLQTIAVAKRDLAATQQSDPLDVASAENTVKQREAALATARTSLANYSVRAPFAGIIAKVNVNKGDTVSSGTAVATMIAHTRIAQLALNEVDVAKLRLGQKATLTFDAVPGLSITGELIDIDTLGTVTQGVVTYTVKIGFDTQDDRIKPGMSVSAAIITDVKQNVLLVPNSAIKTLSAQVELGISNDTSTEIISGLKEGDSIIIRTISATAPKTSNAPSLFGGGGGGARNLGR